MYDTHIHTNNSPDSTQSIDTVCASAIERGLSGISICDHAEGSLFHMFDFHELIKSSVKDVRTAKDRYSDKIKILQGIEISEFFWDETKLSGFYSLADYDVILGSVHRVACTGHNDSFSRVSMADSTEENLHEFLRVYFNDMIRMIQNYDFDVLSHLSVPLRYINGKYGRGIKLSRYEDAIMTILKMIIEKGIALEINTSGIDSDYGDFFPDKSIIRKYRDMGGEFITIGSDSHTPERIGYGFEKAKETLKEIGFSHYYYYEKRKPVKVGI